MAYHLRLHAHKGVIDHDVDGAESGVMLHGRSRSKKAMERKRKHEEEDSDPEDETLDALQKKAMVCSPIALLVPFWRVLALTVRCSNLVNPGASNRPELRRPAMPTPSPRPMTPWTSCRRRRRLI